MVDGVDPGLYRVFLLLRQDRGGGRMVYRILPGALDLASHLALLLGAQFGAESRNRQQKYCDENPEDHLHFPLEWRSNTGGKGRWFESNRSPNGLRSSVGRASQYALLPGGPAAPGSEAQRVSGI
jgi:hypothetical protein